MKIESAIQWRNFMKPKLPGGVRIYNPPKINLNEYGFRRFARKPPYFKFRRYQRPLISTNYQSLPVKYNKRIFINYSWDHISIVHELKDYIERDYKGIKVETVGNDQGNFSIESESGKSIFKMDKNPMSKSFIDEIYKSLHKLL